MGAKADYTHEITHFNGRDVLKIEDMNIGNISVTNDIENVVTDIARMENIDPCRYMIVYKDSEGLWDGWDHRVWEFIPLQCDTWQESVNKYISLQVNS